MRRNEEITLCFDFDGVICENNHGDYAHSKPFTYAIEAINQAFDAGYRVIVCTARYGQRYPGRAYQFGYEEALNWLRNHGVKFHELYLGKPAADLYIDDKAIHIDSKKGPEEWMPLWSRLKELNGKNQYNEPDREIQSLTSECAGSIETMLDGFGIPVRVRTN